MSPRRLRTYLVALGLGIGASGTVLAFDAENGLRPLWSLRAREARLETRIASLARERVERTRAVLRLRSEPRAIERLARGKLGMVRPGEIVVRLEPSPAVGAPPASSSD